jgi:hypothetical protein
MIPQVKFQISRIDETLDVIMHFLNSNEGSHNQDQIFEKYPLLEEKLRGVEEDKKREIVKNFFNKFETKNKKIFELILNEFQKEWDKINNGIMKALEEVNEIKWNEKYDTFIVRITSNPICPRYLDKNTFDIYFGVHNDLMIKISLHEISHFIFFEKWKEIFPDYKEEEFEFPHLIWKLSEIVPYIILSDKKIQDIYLHEPVVYDAFHKVEVDGKPLLNLLKEIYSNKKDFEDFVKKSWVLIQENKDKL